MRQWIKRRRAWKSWLRLAATRTIQAWFRRLKYLARSLADRVWDAVQEQRYRDEKARKQFETRFFGSRTIQCAFRCYASRVILADLREKRRSAIYDSALLEPRRSFYRAPLVPGEMKPIVRRDGVMRYTFRYCGICSNRHASAWCAGCQKEICQHCELKFHCPGGKWAHHPPRRELLPVEDSPPTLLDHSQAARQRYEFIWFLPLMQTLTNTRRTRQDMYKELFLEVSQRNAAKEELKMREKDTKERAKLRAITIFQSLWRRWYVQKGNSVLGTLNLRERRSLLAKAD